MSYLGCSVRLLPLVVYWRAHFLFRMLGSSFTSSCLLEGSLFIGGLMSYLRYLCLISGVQHQLRCVFALFLFVLCTQCCQFLFIVHF